MVVVNTIKLKSFNHAFIYNLLYLFVDLKMPSTNLSNVQSTASIFALAQFFPPVSAPVFWKCCFKDLLLHYLSLSFSRSPSVLASVESYTLTELGDVSLPTDTPSPSASIDDLSPISPSNNQPPSSRRPSTTSTRSLKALKRWLSSPVRRLSLGGGGKGQSSKVIQSPDGSGYMFLPHSPAQSPLSPTEKSKKLPHSYRSLVCT